MTCCLQISIPLETVISVEKNSLEFVDALTVRVLDGESSCQGDTYPFCYLNNLQAAHDRLQAVLSDFKDKHPEWATASLLSSQKVINDQQTEIPTRHTSQTATPLAASQITTEKSRALSPVELSAVPHKATRRASIETITTSTFSKQDASGTQPIPIPARPGNSDQSALLDDHTYPPGTLASSPSDGNEGTPGKSGQWPIPNWLRGAPRLINAVAKPTIPNLIWPVGATRRITEVLSSPTQPDRSLQSNPQESSDNQSKLAEEFRTIFLLPASEVLHYCELS